MKNISNNDDNSHLATITIIEMNKKLEWIKAIDNDEVTVDEKLKNLIKAVECPKEFLILFEALIVELKERLCRLFPQKYVKVLGFGSFLTNLALKDSDLDLIIDISSLTEEKILRDLKKLFYGRHFADMFDSVFYIKAKVPILRCQHIIGFQCDISAGNKLSRHNSELIKFYLSMGENYRSIFIVIKFWVKRMGLSEPHLFKNYNVVLLIIFFLQKKQLMPSVEFLQKHPESPPPRIIEGWDSSFLENNNIMPNKSCDTTVIGLLRDFFHFYSEFEFGLYTISPYLGEKLLRPFEFHKNRFINYEKNNGCYNDQCYISVQDVFKHDFNPTHQITKQAVIDFQSQCEDAERLCSEAISNNSAILEKLFTPLKKSRGKKNKNSKPLIMCIGKGTFNGKTEDEICQNWVSETLLAVESVLNKVALVDQITREKDCLQCSTSHIAFNKNKRVEVAKLLPATGYSSNLEHQAAISAALLQLPECSLKTPYNFQLNYQLSRRPTRLVLRLNYKNSNILESEHLQALNKNLIQWLRQIVG